MTAEPSATCTVHHISLNETPGCYNILVEKSIHWTKYFVIAELGLCLLSVSNKTL